MTLVAADRPGVDRLCERLDAGAPVVVPLPSPLPYVVVGTIAAEVNAAKGRPRSQPIGVGVLSLDGVEPALALDDETIALARWLLLDEGVGVLVPVGAQAPAWLSPAITDGMAFLGGRWLPELAELMRGRTHVYMSSANATTGRPAVSAAEAEAIFGDQLLVADGDALRDPAVAHGSSTMIAVAPRRRLTVVRPGVNDRGFDGEPAAYVEDLIRRWRERSGEG